MRTIFTIVATLLLAAAASAQIIVPENVEPHTPIVASLQAELPDGAQIQGGWGCDDSETCKWIAVNPTLIHVWAKPGRHVLTFRGAWLATRSVELPNGEVIQAVTGFGFLDHAAEFTVGSDDDDEDPQPNPIPPPPPPGLRVGVIVEETLERTVDQARLWLELRKTFEKDRLFILDQDQLVGPFWSKFAEAVRDSQLELPVLVVAAEGGQVVRVVKCPDTADRIKKELSQ